MVVQVCLEEPRQAQWAHSPSVTPHWLCTQAHIPVVVLPLIVCLFSFFLSYFFIRIYLFEIQFFQEKNNNIFCLLVCSSNGYNIHGWASQYYTLVTHVSEKGPGNRAIICFFSQFIRGELDWRHSVGLNHQVNMGYWYPKLQFNLLYKNACLCCMIHLSTNNTPRRYYVMAKIAGFLPRMWEIEMAFLAPGMCQVQPLLLLACGDRTKRWNISTCLPYFSCHCAF